MRGGAFVWTARAVSELRRRAAAGESAGEIGVALGCSRSAVAGKCSRLTPRIHLGVGRNSSGDFGPAATLPGRLASGKTVVKPSPVDRGKHGTGSLNSMRSAAPETAVAVADAFWASPARRTAFDPAHAPQGARLVPLEQIGRHECRWPLYEDGPMVFCGCQVTTYDRNGQKDPYCEAHMRLSVASTLP